MPAFVDMNLLIRELSKKDINLINYNEKDAIECISEDLADIINYHKNSRLPFSEDIYNYIISEAKRLKL